MNTRPAFPRTRKIALRVLAAILAIGALFGMSIPANAASYAAGGLRGSYSTYDVACKYKIYGASGVLELTARPPKVYARNATAGAGNDWAWIRYRAFLVDANTGATLTSTNYSAWVKATDNVPATWTGATTLSGGWRGHYVIDYRIEFWNSTAMTGWVADRHNRYQYYNQYNVGPFGPFSSCLRI